MKLLITRLERPEHAGDWHDRPLKWVVTGAETQKFSTKKDAEGYAVCRRRASSFNEAQTLWLRREGAIA